MILLLELRSRTVEPDCRFSNPIYEPCDLELITWLLDGLVSAAVNW